MLTESQHARCKFAAVCSYEAYQRLWDWHHNERYPFLLANGAPLPEFSKSYYNKTRIKDKKNGGMKENPHFCEEFMKETMSLILSVKGWNIKKIVDKGVKMKVKEKEIWVKTGKVKKGEADVVAWRRLGGVGSLIINIETKIGTDTQSPEQRLEQARCERDGELYFIVKDLGGFFGVVDGVEREYFKN